MQPELRAAIVQDARDGRVLMLAWMDDEALRLHARDGRGVVLEQVARANSGTRARRPGTCSRSRRSATTATATHSSSAFARRACVPHRLGARASRLRSGARWSSASATAPRARTSPRSPTPGVARAAQKVGEEGLEAALSAVAADGRLVGGGGRPRLPSLCAARRRGRRHRRPSRTSRNGDRYTSK